MSTPRELTIVLTAWALVLTWSALAPSDRPTWFMETLPVMIAAPLMLATRTRFPLSRVLLWCACVHGIILIVGGHYTYARVPLGFWLQDLFGFSRNHYDRIGHLAQGFVPALLTREILLRCGNPVRGVLLPLLCVAVPLAFSALYEIIEWLAAVSLGQGADAFLGTQGDPWDTQTDMFMALIGAGLALLTLARVQDRQLASGSRKRGAAPAPKGGATARRRPIGPFRLGVPTPDASAGIIAVPDDGNVSVPFKSRNENMTRAPAPPGNG